MRLYCRSFTKLPCLAPGDLNAAAVVELNVHPAALTQFHSANERLPVHRA
jgi:hypothetical protein